jgi:hypothetical protein
MSTFHKIHTEFLHIGSDIIMDNNAESVSDHISDINKHRIINDSSVSGTELLSASKITSLVSDVNGTVNTHINDLSVHRIINDLSVSVTELLSASKIISLANLKEDLSNKNAPSGYAGLTGSGMIPNNLLPPLAITKPALYISIAARDADIANAQEGDVAIVTDVQKSYIYSGVAYIELVTTGSIASINGLVGAAIQINTEHVPEITNLYYTEARVSANTDVVDNTNRIVELENKQAVWYESSSSEICTEVFPSDVTEISSISQGTSFTPIIAGTYRVTFTAQFEMTKGIKINIRTTTAIISLKAQLNALTYTTHVVGYGSETLYAGNYYHAGATTHTGILTFDAQDDPNESFVI